MSEEPLRTSELLFLGFLRSKPSLFRFSIISSLRPRSEKLTFAFSSLSTDGISSEDTLLSLVMFFFSYWIYDVILIVPFHFTASKATHDRRRIIHGFFD